MPSPESMQIRSYLLSRKTAPRLPLSLAEQRAAFEIFVENSVGHPLTRVESVDVAGVPAAWISPPDADVSGDH